MAIKDITSAIGPSAALILAVTLGAITITVSTPALAVDGRTRVGQCIDATANGQRCGWSVNDKGEIDVCDKSGCQYCASATSECTSARIIHRPPPGLPTGTTVVTSLGSFTVRRR
jgi:hypothetical protein